MDEFREDRVGQTLRNNRVEEYPVHRGNRGYQAYRLLHIAFIIAPLVAGFDKFFYSLTQWSLYLSPAALKVLNGHGETFMHIVGVVEIIVGIGMIFKPKYFAYIAAVWMFLIVINLLMGGFYDVALRDLTMGLSALALARISPRYEKYQPNYNNTHTTTIPPRV